MKKKPAACPYRLTSCNWELTLRCTMSCMHCGSRAGRARSHELSLEECFPVADDLVSLGCRDLTLIGGEVFLYRGWERLAEYLSERGVSVNIVTNGYRLGEAGVEQIKRARLVNVGLSIDGMEANHNRIRGRRDAFQQLCHTLELLNRENISTGAVTSLMNFNIADLEQMYAFLTGYGVGVWQLQLVILMGNMEQRNEFLLSRAEVRQVIDFIREKNQDGSMVVIAADSIGYFDDNEADLRGSAAPICYWAGCAAGISSVFIDSIGNVKGCGALSSDVFIEGNLRQASLASIWNAEHSFAYNRKFTTGLLSGTCAGCEVGDLCRGGCRSADYFVTGSLYSNVFCCKNV